LVQKPFPEKEDGGKAKNSLYSSLSHHSLTVEEDVIRKYSQEVESAIAKLYKENRKVSLSLSLSLLSFSFLSSPLSSLSPFKDRRYLQKAQSLSYNLKENKELCVRVLSGDVSGDELVRMKPEDLANRDVQKQREEIKKFGFESLTTGALAPPRKLSSLSLSLSLSLFSMFFLLSDTPSTSFT
jgi:hypothetical protein